MDTLTLTPPCGCARLGHTGLVPRVHTSVFDKNGVREAVQMVTMCQGVEAWWRGGELGSVITDHGGQTEDRRRPDRGHRGDRQWYPSEGSSVTSTPHSRMA